MTTDRRLLALGLATLIAAICLAIALRKRPHPIIRLAVLTRYSWLTAAAQFSLGVLALMDFPYFKSAMENIFVLDYPSHLCHVTWMSMLLATTCIVTYRTTKTSASDRFADYKAAVAEYDKYYATLTPPRAWHRLIQSILDPQLNGRNLWKKRWLYVAMIGLPIPAAAWRLTLHDLPSIQKIESAGELATAKLLDLSTSAQLAIAALVGVVIWLLIMALVRLLQQAFVAQAAMDFGLFPLDSIGAKHLQTIKWLQPIVNLIAAGIAKLGPGFSREVETDGKKERQLLPGHGQLAAFALIVVTAFLISILFFSEPTEAQYDFLGLTYLFPTLVSLLQILLLFVLLVSGAAFFFDYWRVPILLILLIASVINWKLTGADSYYPIVTTAPIQPYAGAVTPPADEQGIRTLVVVTAAGGGIQASAWTTQVLTGLHERYGDQFTRSIGVISAVSGGSVGAMFYLDGLDLSAGGLAAKTNLREIRRAGRKSSLEATAQLWAGRDLVKMIAPFLVWTDVDRGAAIEASWKMRLTNQDSTLATWRKALDEGHFPIVAFNATDVETGDLLVISNAARTRAVSPAHERELASSDERQSTDYFLPTHTVDLHVTTAARLSATFPYVSPICRARDAAAPMQHHVADGGYVDNEGMFTALWWLRHLVDVRNAGKARFDRVVILRIMPFPPPEKEQERFPQFGWLYNFLGPLQAIMNVRTASQVARNNFDVELMRKTLPAMADRADDEDEPKLEVFVVPVQIPRSKSQPPLSWKLSQQQQLNVVEAWNTWRDAANTAGKDDPDNPLLKLDEWFTPRP
jgi:hypothetical protein